MPNQSNPVSPALTSNIDSTLYAVADLERVDLQNGATLLIDRNSEAQMIVAPEVSVALRSCQSFRTLADHSEYLCSTIPQLAGQQADVVRVLDGVRQHGLFTRADDECARLCPAHTVPAVNLPATRVFIITCDRPAAVERLLESMLRTGTLSRHERLFLVDDSRDADNAVRNREAVAQFNLTSPRNMHYVGAAQQRQLMQQIIDRLPGEETAIRFLIDRERWASEKTYGLARNLCLLLSVGQRAIVMDDDVLCRAMISPHSRDGLLFAAAPREVDFYDSEQEILARSRQADFDPLTGHALCLGLTLAQAVKRLGIDALEPHHLEGSNAAYLHQWSAHSPILVTQAGTLGDPGTTDTRWIYMLDSNSTRRLLDSPGRLEGALKKRHYWMGQPKPAFSKMAVISQTTGLDNSQLLPPYFPIYRGEDYLFGAMTEYLHPQGVTLDYAWSVLHFPLESRVGGAENLPVNGKGGFNPSKFVTDRTAYSKGVSVQTRLEGLVQMVAALGEASDRELRTRYRVEAAEGQATVMARLNRKLQDPLELPGPWQEYLQQSINNIGQAMQSPARVEDFTGAGKPLGADAIMEIFRGYCREFGAALASWEVIREQAREVSEGMLERGEMTPL